MGAIQNLIVKELGSSSYVVSLKIGDTLEEDTKSGVCGISKVTIMHNIKTWFREIPDILTIITVIRIFSSLPMSTIKFIKYVNNYHLIQSLPKGLMLSDFPKEANFCM